MGSKTKSTPLLDNVLEKIRKLDSTWQDAITETKQKIEFAIEIGKHEDPDLILDTILETENGVNEMMLIKKAIDNIHNTKTKISQERVKALLKFKDTIKNIDGKDADEALDEIEDTPDPPTLQKRKRPREEIVKIGTTTIISDDDTPNEEKKRKIGKIATWRIDNTETPHGWYKIENQENKPILIIRSEDIDKEQIKETITMEWLDLPAEDGLISAIFTGPTNCKIETLDDYNRTLIYTKLKHNHPEWSIEYPKLKQPKIKLTNVIKPEYIDWSKWLEIVKKKNKWDDSYIALLDSQKIKGEDKYIITLEVDGKTRANIEDRKGAIVGPIGTSYALDVLPIQRCLNCLSYSHWTNQCTVQDFCLRCTKNHKTYNCPRKEDKQKWYCGGCHKRGHSFLSRKCPRFLKAISVAIRQINYNYGWIMAPKPSIEEDS